MLLNEFTAIERLTFGCVDAVQIFDLCCNYSSPITTCLVFSFFAQQRSLYKT